MIAEDDHEPVGSKLPSRTVDRVTETVLHHIMRGVGILPLSHMVCLFTHAQGVCCV